MQSKCLISVFLFRGVQYPLTTKTLVPSFAKAEYIKFHANIETKVESDSMRFVGYQSINALKSF